MKALQFLFKNVKQSPITTIAAIVIAIGGFSYGYKTGASISEVSVFVIAVLGLLFAKDPKTKSNDKSGEE